MAEDKDSKTEEPTGRRLEKARNEGDIPMSQEVKSLAMLLGALIVVGTMAPWAAGRIKGLMAAFIAQSHTYDVSGGALPSLMTQTLLSVAFVLALPFFVLIVMALIGGIGQVGLAFTPNKMSPKLSTLSPIAGFRRLFSLQSVVEAGKSIVKIVLVSALVGLLVVPTIRHPDTIIGQDLLVTLTQIHWLIVMILFLVVMVMIVLASADFAFQIWQHKDKLKMTKQEVKDEHKETEGDPKVKSRIRALRLERHRARMMANVPKASVIITNPTHYAVALKYEMDDMAAPVLVAKGVDYLAKRIRQVAETHEVPIVENPPLARALYAAVEIDQEIPQEHYKAVAEIIGYVMKLKGTLASSNVSRGRDLVDG